jgi:hypothetical protein
MSARRSRLAADHRLLEPAGSEFRAALNARLTKDVTAVIDDVILGTWFASCDTMELVETADTGIVGDRHSFSYRLQGTNGDGMFVIEQRAYFDIAEGKITWMRVLCSGFQPLTSHP